MSSDPSQMITSYLHTKYNLPLEESKFKELLEKYNNSYGKDKQLISTIFTTLFGLTIESLESVSINRSKTEFTDISQTIKDLSITINKLTQNIGELSEVNEELKSNYWKLNQSLINSHR